MGQEKDRGHNIICENARDVLRAEAMEVGLGELYGQPQTRKLASEVVTGLATEGRTDNVRTPIRWMSRKLRTRTGAQQGSARNTHGKVTTGK